MIEHIDRLVGESRRDEFVTEAVNARLRAERVAAFEKFAGSLADVDIPGWETSESAAEWVHALRYHPDRLLPPPERDNEGEPS